MKCFGASSILVRCRDEAELTAVLKAAEGQLTATIQMDEGDTDMAARLVPCAERKAGRILANGWPTGVEVAHAMVHGGPFPSTSDARTTSVGSLRSTAICAGVVPEPVGRTAAAGSEGRSRGHAAPPGRWPRAEE